MKFQVKILQFIFLFLPFLFRAQTYPFTIYGVQDGLSQSNVSAIIQDHSGYLWLASESGVSKFDGKNFTNYTTENGLADNNVSTLLLDSKGNIWMGHENGSITKYNGKEFTAIKSDALPKDKKIYSIYEDKSGGLWISTATFGVINILDPAKDFNDKSNYKVYSSKEGLSQYVFSSFEDAHGNFWFLTDVGIKFFDKNTNKIDFFRPEGTFLGQITSIEPDNNKNLLIGTSSGSIFRYTIDKKTIEELVSPGAMMNVTRSAVSNFIYAMHEDKKGDLWASVYNFGVCRYNSAQKKLTLFNSNNGLSANKIKCIAEDREGNILLGTLGEGMEIFKGEKFVSFSKKDGLVNNQVWAICRDKNSNYWFGTNEGITVYNPNEIPEKAFKTISVAEGLSNNNVRTIVADKKGNLWIGSWGGKVCKYDAALNKIVSVPALNEIVNPFVSCLLVDSKNKLWIGTIEGIVCFDLENESVKTYRTINGLCDNDITCFYENSNGEIWIGTKQKGISVYNGTATFKTINKENGLTYQSVTSICEDAKKQIWIGTEGGGAFVYGNNVYQNYKVKDGLVSDFITLVTTDENKNVWLGTNKGLSKFNSATNTFQSYLKNDGFTGIETKSKSVYNDNEGNIWFGTVNGVFKYNSKFDVPVSLEPLTQITSLRINSKEYPIGSDLQLSYKENSLSFDYVGISFSNPDEVKYKVKLEGVDEDWRPATKQTFQIFSNLHPGKYIFKVMACNNFGICNKEPISISFTITPPFWKTWWFYVLVAIVSITLIFSFIKIRERNLIIEKKILEEKVKERTAEVVEKNIELDEKNKDITASIRYAKRIQDAILPPDEFVRKFLPKTFVLFKPKDIVSGDFYWLSDKQDMILFAAVDCTGHGVPGAFMSIVGHNLLDQIVGEHGITEPAKILNELNKSVSDTLRQSYTEDNSVKDGMDISLCCFNRKTNVMEYAGAYNPLWLIRNGELTEIKADKFPIGNLKAGENKKFTNHSIPLEKGDTLYIFSDGYADQFGGPQGKKFKYSAFKQLLLDNQNLSMEEQGELLEKEMAKWQGSLEQVDDILVIGTRL